jgi:hypothetical protein
MLIIGKTTAPGGNRHTLGWLWVLRRSLLSLIPDNPQACPETP